MKTYMSYFTVKTKLEYTDGRIIEGYMAYDFENDETFFTAPVDSEFICAYMSFESSNKITKKIREALKSVKKINGIRKISVKTERVKTINILQDLSKSCLNGSAYYYLSFGTRP